MHIHSAYASTGGRGKHQAPRHQHKQRRTLATQPWSHVAIVDVVICAMPIAIASPFVVIITHCAMSHRFSASKVTHGRDALHKGALFLGLSSQCGASLCALRRRAMARSMFPRLQLRRQKPAVRLLCYGLLW